MRCTTCSHEVRPVVALDIDGTMAEYHETITRFSDWYFALEPDRSEPWNGSGEMEDYLGITKVQYREMKLAFRQGGHKRRLPIIHGARDMAMAAKEHGAEIWVATSRPWQRLDNIDPDTRFWLEQHEIPFDGLLYGDDKYQQLVDIVERDRIVAIVDDLPEQIERLSAMRLPYFQHYQPHNEWFTNRWSPGGTLMSARAFIINQICNWKDANNA